MLAHFARIDRHACAKGIAPTHTTVEKGVVLMNEQINSKICLTVSIKALCMYVCMYVWPVFWCVYLTLVQV